MGADRPENHVVDCDQVKNSMPPPDLPSRPESPRIRWQAAKLALAVAVWLASSFLVVNTPDGSWVLDWVPLFILLMLTPVVSFACIILCSFELFGTLRAVCVGRPFLGLIFGIPQFLFGLFCFAVGLGMGIALFYFLFVEHFSEYLGIQTLLLVLLVVILLFSSARKHVLYLLHIIFFGIFGIPLGIAQFGYECMAEVFRPYVPEENPDEEEEVP